MTPPFRSADTALLGDTSLNSSLAATMHQQPHSSATAFGIREQLSDVSSRSVPRSLFTNFRHRDSVPWTCGSYLDRNTPAAFQPAHVHNGTTITRHHRVHQAKSEAPANRRKGRSKKRLRIANTLNATNPVARSHDRRLTGAKAPQWTLSNPSRGLLFVGSRFAPLTCSWSHIRFGIDRVTPFL